MICSKCGNNLNDTAKFCPKCGNPTVNTSAADNSVSMYGVPSYDQAPIYNEMQKEPKKLSKRTKAVLIIIPIIAVLLAVAGVVCYILLLSPNARIMKKIENSDYAAVAEIYADSFSSRGEDTAKIEQAVAEDLDALQESYKKQEISYENAKTKLSEIRKIKNKNITAKADNVELFIDSLNNSRNAYKQAEEYAKDNNYTDALSSYKKVIKDDSNYDSAQEEIAKLLKLYKSDILAEAKNFVNTGDYIKAINVLNDGLKIAENDSDLKSQITLYENGYADSIIAQADELVKAGKYEEAKTLLTKAMNVTTDDTVLTDKITEIENAYVDYILTQADALVAKRDYDGAEKLLKSALDFVPNNKKLNDKITSVNSSRPTKLKDVHVIDSHKYDYNSDVFTDSFGNDYNGRYLFDCYFNNPYAVYNLNEEYSTFSGSIVAGPNTGSGAVMNISFYNDKGDMIYTKTGYTKTTGKIDFNVDVSGVTKLTVKATGNNKENYIYIVDPVLYK